MRKRFIVAAVLSALAAPFVVALPFAIGRASAPVLGSSGAFPNGKGFGTVKPRTVFLGGDPTGNVSSIHWTAWGAGRAVGFGRGWCPGRSVASGHPCEAALHVSDLGRCHGRQAYRRLAFYFKSRHRWTAGSKWAICGR